MLRLYYVFEVIMLTSTLLLLKGANAVCPPTCSCNEDTLTVSCKENTLGEVPITLNPAIERLILKHNKIKTVDAASFQFYGFLNYIDFSDNQLVRIPGQAFVTQSRLIELHMNRNKLSNITDKTFFGLKSLTVLNLRSNYIEDLSNKVFVHLTQLKELDLGQNRIQRIDPGTFEGLNMLKVLFLDDNQLGKVPTPSFQFLASLAELRIGLNSFGGLANESFVGLNSLTNLDLTGAGLVNVSDNAFKGLNRTLRSLILTDNHLASVPTKQLSELRRLEELSIGQNPFASVSRNAFRGLGNLRTLEISGAAELTAVESGAFIDNLNLETFSLTSNKRLSFVDEAVFTGLPNLKNLILRDNALTTFRETLAAWPELHRMDLSENPLDCECSLLWLKDLLLQRNTTHVLCATPPSLKDKSLRHLTSDDLGCSTYVGSHQTIVGALCGVVVAFVALLIVLVYRYRHKMRDMFKNYEWNKQAKASSKKQAEYQKTFNDDEFIIRTAQHQTLKPIPVTEL